MKHVNGVKQPVLTDIFRTKETFEKILDISAEGLMVMNRDGIIVYVNKSFEKIHGISKNDAEGRHVTEIMENTRMHIVTQTSAAEINEIQTIGGHEYIVSRVPLMVDNRCIGVVGKIRFQDTETIKGLTRKILKLEKKLRKPEAKNPDTRYTFKTMVAFSEASLETKNMAIRASASQATVLLLGESGVGKEVFAQSIHNMSSRCTGPFVMLNCSAIQESLFESELFGYEEGAFTDAKKGGKKGKFELADTGTIFLDEIGDMPFNVQAKMLRAIQEKEIDKVGGEKRYDIDVRIIAATNRNLEQLVAQGKFRKDLFYRLNVIPIYISPLRERRSDIPELIRFIWEQLKKEYGIYHKQLDHGAVNVLKGYHWPGNIRELRNILERLMILVPQEEITQEPVRTILLGQGAPAKSEPDGKQDLHSLVAITERKAISQALISANNNRSEAARVLGISRALLYKKMHLYKMMDN